MGREVKRVPFDFNFPLERSYHDAMWDEHRNHCQVNNEDDHGDCEFSTSPPTGEGWQLWQTVSDGPISPVFRTADALIEWMTQPVPAHKRRSYAPEAFPKMPWAQGWTRTAAEALVKSESGWMPSFVMKDGEVLSTEETVKELHKDSR